MKLSLPVTIAILAASSSSFASGKNVVTCGWNQNDDSLVIRQDAGGQLVALLSMVDHGTIPYKVEQVATPPHVMGAGLNYKGSEISVHLNTDGDPNKNGIYTVVSIPSSGINNEVFYCRLSH